MPATTVTTAPPSGANSTSSGVRRISQTPLRSARKLLDVSRLKALGWAPALTPPDDEVEALARLVDPGAFVAYDPQICDPSWPAEVEHWQTEARHHAARILAAGFRRSEVPEPSAEERDAGLSDAHSESYRAGWRDSRASVQGEPSDAGVGWFEWFKMPENTTEIAYVHESGEVFDPVRGWNPVEFTIAAAEGRVFRLVRAGGVR